MTADHYGIKANMDWGFAPNSDGNLVRNTWVEKNCKAISSTPLKQLCQNASDDFGIVHDRTFGRAPQEVQDWWTAHMCEACPGGTLPCPPAP
jgi:hypothetical protein